jgi:hypothetical protein
MNRTRPKIVKATASKIIQRAYGPAPKPMGGSGSIHMTVPALMDAPKKTVATIITIIPMNIRMKPTRKTLNGVCHGKDSGAGVSLLRRL